MWILEKYAHTFRRQTSRPPLLTAYCLVAVCWSGWTLPASANPERVTFQSALVWRSDGTGDFPLPALAGPTTYESSEAIPTDGPITRITAAWTFEGHVSLDLSADNGLHYTPAVHGVPLTSLTGGKRLKWRATLGPASRLTEVKIGYADRSGVTETFGEPALSGFGFRKPIALTGSSSGDLFHYQLKLRIGESAQATGADVHCEGRLRSDFSDIRLTTADGQTLLPHYLERLIGASPARIAVVWVMIPHLPTEGLTLYLYYGHPGAKDLSDGRAVFDFFDDFEGRELAPAGWDVRPAGQGSATVSGSQAHLSSASILSKAFQMTDGIVEYLATTTSGQDDARLIIRSDPRASHPDDTNQLAYASAYGGAQHAIAVGNVVKTNDPQPVAAGAAYGYRVVARGTTLTFERYDATFTARQAATTFEDRNGLTTGSLGLSSEGDATYDWMRVRRDAEPAPVAAPATVPPPEEAVDPPVFTNVTVAPNGSLTLVNPKLPGVYESAGTSTPFMTRILLPNWKGQAAAVDLSADGGLSYLAHCASNVHYYASKGELSPGWRVKSRVTLKSTDQAPAPQLHAMIVDYAPGEVVVIAPNGGERWRAGTTQEIVWTAPGYEPGYPMTLSYSLDGGKTSQTITPSAENRGRYRWTLPDGVTSEKALAQVSDRYAPRIMDASDRLFSIGPSGAPAQEEPARASADVPSTHASVDAADLLEVLGKLSTDPNAIPHEVLIKVSDPPASDLNKGALSYHAGDIVLIRPFGAEWSEAEKNSFLIIQADLSPEAVAMLMSPLEAPTGEVDPRGHPIMRMMGRRKFKVDVGTFDLDPKPSDKGKPAVLRHFRKKQALEFLLRERTDGTPAVPAPRVGQEAR